MYIVMLFQTLMKRASVWNDYQTHELEKLMKET